MSAEAAAAQASHHGLLSCAEDRLCKHQGAVQEGTSTCCCQGKLCLQAVAQSEQDVGFKTGLHYSMKAVL